MSNTVDGHRLWSRLMAMAEVGPAAHGGSDRQAISDAVPLDERLCSSGPDTSNLLRHSLAA